ncbi:WAT1-related protein At2g37460-like [Vicia villosa]|uniref:WAT1-related protein At2g37460-like n=1 Tax=Vicia villosa TaxID=3911 RepID=UPI00273C9402|nr:WAT1-related protein At2g37460-like [Vicia villosa]
MENQKTETWIEKAKPFIAVLSLQLGYAVMDVLSKAALNKGMSNYVFVVYRHAVAFIVITPFALYFEKKVRPKMTISIFIKIMALSLLEPVIDQNLYFLGMKYTTATFAAAMSNMLPAITFILATILRLEKIKIKCIRSQAKILGTIATVAGAMTMTLVKGPILLEAFGSNSHTHQTVAITSQHTIAGGVLITIGCICWACFFNLQAITLQTYPATLSLSSWICLMGTVEGAAVASVMEWGHPSVWSIKWDMRLFSTVYTGIFCSGLAYYLQGVVMKTKGPVFVTTFSPFCMVIVAILGYFLLAEQMFLGRVIGAFIICLGLYLVIWGKNKDYDTSSSQIIEEPVESPKQTGSENCTHEVIIIH